MRNIFSISLYVYFYPFTTHVTFYLSLCFFYPFVYFSINLYVYFYLSMSLYNNSFKIILFISYSIFSLSLSIIINPHQCDQIAEIPPLWQIFKNLWQYIGQSFQLTLTQAICFGHIFIAVCKWPIIENTISSYVWSH